MEYAPAALQLPEDYLRAQRAGYFGVVIWNPKFEENIGALLRTAHVFGAGFIGVFGERWRRYNSDTTASARHVPTYYYGQTPDWFDRLPEDCEPVAVEITEDADSLVRFDHPKRAAYILGPEDGSLPAYVLERCQRKVRIPTRWCLNVAVAGAVVMYDRIAKRVRFGS